MDVISAVKNRRSIRNFKTDQIPKNVLEEIFDAARWAPSWGNTQPCEVFVLTGKPLDEFRKANYEKKRTNAPATPDIKTPTFWPDAQKKRYGEIGKTILTALNIQRDDKEGRNNYSLDMSRVFNAPCFLAFCIPAGVAVEYALLDVGLMIQNVCLLAWEKGLGTCIMAATIEYPELLRKFASIPEDKKIVMGVALGYPDSNQQINRFERPRIKTEELVHWVG